MPNKILDTDSASVSPPKEMADKTAFKNVEMKNPSLHKFFISALKDIYCTENTTLEALKKMQEATTDEDLKDDFENHHFQPRKHVKCLEKVFQLVDETPEKEECKAIKGMIEEDQKTIKPTDGLSENNKDPKT